MQTTIQNNDAIRVGSVKLEIGSSLGSMVDLGALKGVSWTQKGETQEIVFDNVEKIKKFSDGNLFAIKATLGEINWENIQMLNDGQVEIINVAGTLTTVTAEAHGTGWTLGSPIRANYKNGDNTIVGSIVVKAGATTLTAGTDYTTYVADGTNGVNGYTYIVPVTAQTLAITFGYTYTPNASKVVTFNSTGKKVGKYIRMTNYTSDGKALVFTMSGATNISPVEVSFASDNEASVSEMPLEIEGYMIQVTDEQAV